MRGEQSWAGVFVGRVRWLARVAEFDTRSNVFDWTVWVLDSVTRVDFLARPAEMPALNSGLQMFGRLPRN